MTAASLTHLPIAAGSVLMSSVARVAVWAGAWFMRAPLANTGILALVGFTLAAGSNALYLQRHDHPSPLFGVAQPEVPEVEPVVPAVRQHLNTTPVKVDIPAEVPVSQPKVIDTVEVRELQRKLEILKFFEGTVDGIYGPKTARAIRKFEEANGLKVRGELTREILQTVAKAPLGASKPVVEPVPTTDPLPQVVLKTETKPVVAKPEASIEPLKAPEPLVLDGRTPKTATLTRELPKTPEEALEVVAKTAGDAIDTIVAGVQTVAMKRPEPKPVVVNQFVADPAAKTAEEVAALPVAKTKSTAVEAPTKVAMVSAEVTGSVPAALSEEREGEAIVANIPELVTDARPEDLMPAFSVTDPVIVSRVQRGLASLGFLHGPIDGVAGEATAKAIRNFEVYYNYKVTGRITPELPDLLEANGASL